MKAYFPILNQKKESVPLAPLSTNQPNTGDLKSNSKFVNAYKSNNHSIQSPDELKNYELLEGRGTHSGRMRRRNASHNGTPDTS